MIDGELPLAVTAGINLAYEILRGWSYATDVWRRRVGITAEGMMSIHVHGATLHLFRDRYRTCDFHPHCHASRIESLVLVGSLTNNLWVTGHGEPHDCLVPGAWTRTREGDSGPSEWSPREPVLLERQHSARYGCGESYALAHDSIHSTDASNGTLTLFRHMGSAVGDPQVYVPAGKQVGPMGGYRVATREEVLDALAYINLQVRSVVRRANEARGGGVADR